MSREKFSPNLAARMFSDSQPRDTGSVYWPLGRRHSLSIKPVRTTARLIPPSLPVNVASMATMVLFVTRSLWQFQVVRGGLTCEQRLKGPNFFLESLPRPVMRMATRQLSHRSLCNIVTNDLTARSGISLEQMLF